MEIRFSTARYYPEDDIMQIAKLAGCHARVKWATTAAARFQLVRDRDSYEQADTGIQDKVIHALLNLDPEATIKTARAVYEGLTDFKTQGLARLTPSAG